MRVKKHDMEAESLVCSLKEGQNRYFTSVGQWPSKSYSDLEDPVSACKGRVEVVAEDLAAQQQSQSHRHLGQVPYLNGWHAEGLGRPTDLPDVKIAPLQGQN